MEKTKILIVEDDIKSAQTIELQLISIGYEVIGSLASFSEADSFIEKYQPDLILMDIVLSGVINGIEAAKIINSKYSLPIIFITADSRYETFSHANACNLHGYLVKPIKTRDLHISIELALQKYKNDKMDEDRLVNTITHDELTGLHNKDYLDQQIEMLNEDKKNRNISIITLDINGLTNINNNYGYKKGTELIKKISSIISKHIKNKKLISRNSGGMFTIIIYKANRTFVNRIVETIVKCSKQVLNPYGASLSIGSAVENSSVSDIRHLMNISEKRMSLNKLNSADSVHNAVINVLLTVLGERTHETAEHCVRIKELAIKLGKKLNFPIHELDKLSILALLHDIGKSAISDKILAKPSKLNNLEFNEMKKHAEIGAKIISNIPELSEISNLILYHHEKWDGTGYPEGLKGDEIPLLSRIIAVVDAYDAMTHKRYYKEAMTKSTTINELINCVGTQFDPTIVNAFIEMLFEEKQTSNNTHETNDNPYPEAR